MLCRTYVILTGGCQRRQLPVFMSCCAVMELIAFGAVNILMVDYTNTPVQIDKKSSIEIRDFLFSTTNDNEMPDITLTNEVSAKLPALKKKTEKITTVIFCSRMNSASRVLKMTLSQNMTEFR